MRLKVNPYELQFGVYFLILLFLSDCTALSTVQLKNVAVIQSGAFNDDISLKCLTSTHQSAVAKLIQASCISATGFCAPLTGCPIQIQYTFSDNLVAGSMVANVANNFLNYDATLQNGATVSKNHLLLASEHQQFMKIPDFC